MSKTRLALLLVTLSVVVVVANPATAQKAVLRFGVGPPQATPTETKKAYEPFFAHVDLLDFPRLLTILVLILIMVTVIDQGSQWLRQRLN